MPKFESFEDANGNTVEYHVVTEESAGEYVVSTGNNIAHVRPGEVLVKTYRPDVYDVVPDETALGKPAAPVAAPEPDFVIGDDE